ncbi:alpha-hydroxy acid oxidase [Dactylosporangium matsuzakiense]|uniref:Alpha-hydroxy-acid oxidizing enzyme n=1 Tax=Dactylosporangium matsuzakiense TaxID=53360 RepID=A0A9W6NK49_9ACTN|nr:alpha-hydroxy acid oxidase [Dactylosporangium matsuzakiense]UWZ42503.1 alpha-hydroxy-acid oxidizing protein [Dactylosporangium matsuzakiense]GLL00580.1 alpha-hydroxy-acid oxidizing enzyme [Dactylosporangium matsuzakiense]
MLAELRARARDALEPAHWDYFEGGAGDERTLRANEEAFARVRLVPRVLRATGPRDLRTTLLGTELRAPILVAPTAFHRLAHRDGELATAAGAAAAGAGYVVSMAATTPVEAIAAVAGPWWFQLYLQPDRDFTAALVRRVEAAGCRALVVSVDSPVFGRRERDHRNGFHDLPAGLCCENLRDAAGSVRDIAMDAGLGWAAIGWLRGITGLPIVLKGVLHPADAELAVEHGVSGLIVSNHGGRQLDGAVATADALPAVAKAVGGRLPVLVDGGVRRGADILAALALGADAVLVGRPVLWGLAAGGADGVRLVLDSLAEDLDRVLALAGVRTPAAVPPDLVVSP